MVTFNFLATEFTDAPRDSQDVRQAAKRISSKWDSTLKSLRTEQARRRTEQLYDLIFHYEMQASKPTSV